MSATVVGVNTDGFIDRHLYTEPAILMAEQARIFARTWQFVCHTDELKQPGAFKRAIIGGQQLLVVRGDDDRIRALYNSCRHRGTLVESRDQGTCAAFRCPYHHWTYDRQGRLVLVPMEEGYGDWFRKEDYGLVAVPRLESFHGLVFVSLDPAIAPLVEYLGPAAPYLEYSVSYRGQPLAVIGTYEYTIEANWKLLIENTMDGYHVSYLHQRAMSGRGPSRGRLVGEALDLGIHACLVWEYDVSAYSIQQERLSHKYNAIFPNLLALYNATGDMMALRVVRPVAVDRMVVLTYCLGVRGEAPSVSERRARAFAGTWGPGGRFGADDIDTLRLVQQGLTADNGAPLLVARGLEGNAVGRYEDEQSLRSFWRGWRQYMNRASAPVADGPAERP